MMTGKEDSRYRRGIYQDLLIIFVLASLRWIAPDMFAFGLSEEEYTSFFASVILLVFLVVFSIGLFAKVGRGPPSERTVKDNEELTDSVDELRRKVSELEARLEAVGKDGTL